MLFRQLLNRPSLANIYASLAARDLKRKHGSLWKGKAPTKISSLLFSKALKLYETVIEDSENPTAALYYRGLAFEMMGRHRAALTSFSQCIALDQNFLPALYESACTRHKLGDSNVGLVDLIRLQEMDPSHPQLDSGLGAISFALHRYSRAQREFHKALDEDRGSRIYNLYGRGLSLLRMRVLTKAKECFSKILQQEPSHFDANYGMGYTCLLQGNYVEALRFFERAARTVPSCHIETMLCIGYLMFILVGVSMPFGERRDSLILTRAQQQRLWYRTGMRSQSTPFPKYCRLKHIMQTRWFTEDSRALPSTTEI